MTTLWLTRPLFISGHTYDADEAVTVTEERAIQLIEAGIGIREIAPPDPPPDPDSPSGKSAKRTKKS